MFDALFEMARLINDALGLGLLIQLPSGDTQCPACGVLNPDVPEWDGGRCDYCEDFAWI